MQPRHRTLLPDRRDAIGACSTLAVAALFAVAAVSAQELPIDPEDREEAEQAGEARMPDAGGQDEAEEEAAEAIEDAEDALDDETEAGEAGLTFGIEIAASVVRGGEEPGVDLHAFPFAIAAVPIGAGWSLEAALAPEIFRDDEADGADGLPFDDPEGAVVAAIVAPDGARAGVLVGATYDLGKSAANVADRRLVFAEAPRFGQIAYGTADSALGEYCVEPPSGSSNFDTDELLGFGVCEGLAEDGTLVWRSPSVGPGFAVAVSVTSSDDGALDPEVAARSTSAMLLYSGDFGSGVLDASLGFERITKFAGRPDHGAASATSLQAGFAASRGRWTWGAAGNVHDLDAPGLDAWAIGVGAAYAVDARLTATAGLYLDRLNGEDDRSGRRETERSGGLAIEYVVVEDRLSIDAGIAYVDRSFDPRNDTRFGVGLSLTR